MIFFHTLQQFWSRHPALLYGLSCLLGVNVSLHWNVVYLLPIALLVITAGLRRGAFTLCLIILSLLYTSHFFLFPPTDAKIQGQGIVSISSLSFKTSSFGKRWVYRGTLSTFYDANGNLAAKNIPISISLLNQEDLIRPLANHDYLISGELKEIRPHYYVLNTKTSEPWFPIPYTWSLADWRFHFKQAVNTYIKQTIPGYQEGLFLGGIATGEFNDRLMFTEFGRFGLQHIMAISGFHFAIIAAILSVFLRMIIRTSLAHAILIALLSSYFIFLGASPSIVRAWIAILIVLAGFLLERRGSGLNSLGVALLVVLWIDPLQSQSMGFQFSFIITAAILLFYNSADYFMQLVLVKRPLSQMIGMNTLNQHGYCLLTFLRQALSLTVAVNLIALPLTVYYFNKFPVLSILYNLFFPFLVSFAMLLLLIGMFLSFIPFIGNLVHTLNYYYTKMMLNFVYNIPTSLDVHIRTKAFSLDVIIVYLCFMFVVGIILKDYIEKKSDEMQDLVFL